MSNKSKQAKQSKKPKVPQTNGPSRRSKKSKKTVRMSNPECTLCDPGFSNPACPFRIKYANPLPPLKNSIGFPSITNATGAMFAIFPQFATSSASVADGTTARFSAFILSSTDANLGNSPTFDAMVTNTPADNQYVAVTASGGNLLNSTSSYDNYRIWSSCIKLINTVQITSNQGQVAIIPDVTVDQFLYGGSSGGALSINDAFSMALPQNTHRIGDEHCVCFSPEEFPDGVLKTMAKGAVSCSNPSGATTPTIQVSGTSNSENFEPKGIIIALRNTTVAQITALLIRQETLAEAIYSPVIGVIRQARIVQDHDADDVVRTLSKKSPNWRRLGMKALNAGAKMAGDYIQENGAGIMQRLLLGAIL